MTPSKLTGRILGGTAGLGITTGLALATVSVALSTESAFTFIVFPKSGAALSLGNPDVEIPARIAQRRLTHRYKRLGQEPSIGSNNSKTRTVASIVH